MEFSMPVSIEGDNEYGAVIEFFTDLRKKGFRITTDEDGDAEVFHAKQFDAAAIDAIAEDNGITIDCNDEDLTTDETPEEKTKRIESKMDALTGGADPDDDDKLTVDEEDDD